MSSWRRATERGGESGLVIELKLALRPLLQAQRLQNPAWKARTVLQYSPKMSWGC